MTPFEARVEATRIVEGEVQRCGREWIRSQRRAGRGLAACHREITEAHQWTRASIAAAVEEIAPLLIQIAAGKAMLAAIAAVDDPEAALLDDLRRRGVRLHPLHGWWPC